MQNPKLKPKLHDIFVLLAISVTNQQKTQNSTPRKIQH